VFDIPFSARISVPDGVHLVELHGSAMLLDERRECYYGLDETGRHIWHVLAGSPTVQAAFDRLLAVSEGSPEGLRENFERLLEDLSRHALVRLANA
jgi:hypothetical protein